MAVKSANIMARVEPDVKERAEEIMDKLGVPASIVINMLYKQIIYTGGIPFNLTLPKSMPIKEELSKAEFDAMMQTGYDQALRGEGKPARQVVSELRKEIASARNV